MKRSGIKHLREIISPNFMEILNKIYSQKEVDTILLSFLKGRESSLRINNLKGNRYDVLKELKDNKIKFREYGENHQWIIFNKVYDKSIRKLNCYIDGQIYLQNISSILPAIILNPEKGEKILDMCAAPGGKTLLLWELLNNSGELIANEFDKIRVQKLQYNINKQGAHSVQIINKNGCVLGGIYKEYFHKVLVDAPCSGEGTLTFNNLKEFKYLGTKSNIYTKKQKALLESAYKCVKRNGLIVYSTCTLNPYENEFIINSFLDKHKDMIIEKINIKISNYKDGIIEFEHRTLNSSIKKSIRIIPDNIMEGFYICKLRKIF